MPSLCKRHKKPRTQTVTTVGKNGTTLEWLGCEDCAKHAVDRPIRPPAPKKPAARAGGLRAL